MATRARADYELRAVDKSKKGFDSFEGRLKRSSKLFESVSSKLFAGLGFGIALGGLTAIAKRTTDAADRLGKLSKQLGVSAKFLDFLQFAADRSGTSFETFTKAIKRQGEALGEALRGRSTQRDAFAALGLDPKTLEKQSPEKTFLTIVAALDKLQSQARRLSVAKDIFGRGGAELFQAGGVSGLADLTKDFQRLTAGGITDKQVANAEAFNDAMTNVSTAVKALTDNLLTGSSDVTDFLNTVADSIGRINAYLKELQGLNPFDRITKQVSDFVLHFMGRGVQAGEALMQRLNAPPAPEVTGSITPTTSSVRSSDPELIKQLRALNESNARIAVNTSMGQVAVAAE